jgi:hypothetical protein
MPVTSLAAPGWLTTARRLYRFMDRPIGCLSYKAKFCLVFYTVLLLIVLWAVSLCDANLPDSGALNDCRVGDLLLER